MKKWLLFICLATTVWACQPPAEETELLTVTVPEGELPDNVEQLRAMLTNAKIGQQKLDGIIKRLEDKIGERDTSEIRKTSVTAVKVDKGDFKSYSEIQAVVQADKSTMASSETGGRLLQMTWEEGQYIKKGDLVAKLDLEAVDKQIAEIEKRLELAVTVYERQKRLWDQNIGSEMQYLQAKNNMESLEKSLETVKFQTTKANVYSPASGVIDMVMVKQGEMAGPGAPILMIMNTGTVKVVAGVPEKYLKNVKRGNRVTVKFPSLEEERKARVTLIGRSVNAANRTFDVEVELSNPGGILKPNLTALMLIGDEPQKDVVLIAEELIRQDIGGQDYVFVVDKSDKGEVSKKVYVTTGDSFEGKVVVEEGLKGGELIIEQGGRGLSENQPVSVTISQLEEEKNNG